ncbi:GlxA family transcriptional regulator [Nocardia rosealba]|uniref:GlxA family transcriptional regulator n=1 Tax=Nocardia rosealba TaxID=2878563 RepID=UPI001CD97AD8|nr:helix-turn-helix domain-containing protein [Nocardia rosealba]MCA2210492.1 helix-turn-helix domain-containing protein [Nocardia rosealba]
MAVHRVAVLARTGVMPMELGIVHQIFGSARSADGERLYEVLTCAIEPGLVRTDADFAIAVEHGSAALTTADTIVVPASHELDEVSDAAQDQVAEQLRLARAAGRRIASICTGAFVLARAGLLDGRRATTHWLSADRLRAAFPAVRIDAAVLFTEDDGIFTAAGEAAGIDLCLHLIRTDHGAAVAGDVARRTVVPPYREGGQAQFIDLPLPAEDESTTSRTRVWALNHLDRPLTLRVLAEHATMSPRTFTRRFRRETGMSPGAWLAAQRLIRARQLLEQTTLGVDQIAERAGFGTGASLRQHFARSLGTSPSAYRATFHGGG